MSVFGSHNNIRAFWNLLRFVTWVAPAVLLAVWGGSFVYALAITLSAPNRPLQFTYQSPGGVLNLRAQTYSFDFVRGNLWFQRPALFDPDGKRLASAEYVEASNIYASSGNGLMNVRAREVKGSFVRLKDGRVPVLEYLPKPSKQPGNTPFHVVIDRIQADFADESGAAPWSTHLSSPSIVIEGLGQAWVASGQANLSGVGSTAFQIESLAKDSYRGDIQSSRLDLGPAYRHFSTTEEADNAPFLKDFAIDRLTANGPFSFAFQPGKSLAFESRLDVSGAGVKYRSEPKADAAHFVGYLASDGLNGVLTASNASASARYEGSMSWRNGIELGGDLQARAASRTAIGPTLSKLLPEGVRFERGEYRGWLGYSKGTGWSLRGTARGSAIAYDKDSIALPTFDTVLGGKNTIITFRSGSWHGAPVVGNLSIERGSKVILGAIKASGVPLQAAAARFGISGLSGTGELDGIFAGTLDRPKIDIRANGNLAYRDPNTPSEVKGVFEAGATYDAPTLHVIRSVIRSDAGTLSAQGDLDAKTKALSLDVVGAGLRPEFFSPDLAGTGALEAHVFGTLANPAANGRAEVFGGRYKVWELPVLAASLRADRDSVTGTDLRAVSGASEADGNVSLDLKSKALSGTFSAKGVQLTDVFKQGPTGVLDITDARIGGTLAKPETEAKVKGTSIVAAGLKVDSVTGNLALRDTTLSGSSLEAQLAGGTIKGSGNYDLKTKQGDIAAQAESLHLGRLFASLAGKGAVLDGTVGGQARFTLDESGVVKASGAGDMLDVSLNQTPIGKGPWELSTADNTIHGSLQIGYLDRFLEATNIAYNVDSRALSGDFNVLNLDLSDAIRAAAPFLADLQPDTQERLRSIEGSLVAKASIGGTWPKLDVTVPSFAVQELKYQDRPFGTLESTFDRKGSQWDIAKFEWRNGDTALRAHGRVDESSDLALDGELSRFDLTQLALLDQRLGGLSGSADFSFLASGATKSPEISASLKSDRFEVGGAGRQMEFGLLLDSIHLTESSLSPDGSLAGGLTAEGEFTYRGLTGRLSGQLPFKYPLDIPVGQPLSVTVSLPDRSLASMSDFYPGIDAKRTTGSVAGNVRLFGRADALKAEGDVTAQAESFAINGVASALLGAKGSLSFRDDLLNLSLRATSSTGGAVAVDAATRLQDAGKLLALIAEGNEQEILDAAVAGSAKLSRFHVVEGSKDSGNVDTVIDSNLTLAGTIGEPAVKGSVSLAGANVLLPGKPLEQTGNPHYLIDPTFDVSLLIADSARVRTSAATLDIVGNGRLQGSLSQPNLTAGMTVTSGSLRLPTARVAIQPDGTLSLVYIVGDAGDLNARMDVNLEGRTSVTTLLYGDTVQRYDITLQVQGDLFKEGGLNLTAASDPPDLSQEKILALLGQADVLQAFTGSVPSQEAQKQIRTALTGVAVPVLLDPVTSRLATSLGLTYLNVEYNAYEQATFAFGKALGKGLTLQGRRQLSEPVVGTRATYDLRLSYRLPVSKGVLSRTTLSFGADQDRPWKIAVEYGTRF